MSESLKKSGPLLTWAEAGPVWKECCARSGADRLKLNVVVVPKIKNHWHIFWQKQEERDLEFDGGECAIITAIELMSYADRPESQDLMLLKAILSDKEIIERYKGPSSRLLDAIRQRTELRDPWTGKCKYLLPFRTFEKKGFGKVFIEPQNQPHGRADLNDHQVLEMAASIKKTLFEKYELALTAEVARDYLRRLEPFPSQAVVESLLIDHPDDEKD